MHLGFYFVLITKPGLPFLSCLGGHGNHQTPPPLHFTPPPPLPSSTHPSTPPPIVGWLQLSLPTSSKDPSPFESFTPTAGGHHGFSIPSGPCYAGMFKPLLKCLHFLLPLTSFAATAGPTIDNLRAAAEHLDSLFYYLGADWTFDSQGCSGNRPLRMLATGHERG